MQTEVPSINLNPLLQGSRSITQLLENGEKLLFSGKEIVAATHDGCQVLEYEDLSKFNTIEDMFAQVNAYGTKGKKAIALLYQVKQNEGHWVAVIYNPDEKHLEVFDTYGFGKLDAELDYAKYNDTPYLSDLVDNAGGNIKVDVNNTQIQKGSNTVNTCGRHVAMRINFIDMEMDEYIEMMKKNPISTGSLNRGTSMDAIVTLATLFF